MEHGKFTWLEPASHSPVRWEKCKCWQAMDCTFADSHVVFRCWKEITGCQQMKQVNYAAIVNHAECVLRGIRLPAQEQLEPEEEAIELYNVSQGSTAISAVYSEPSRAGLPISLTHGLQMARLREADARFCGSCFYMAIHDCRCCNIILVRPVTVCVSSAGAQGYYLVLRSRTRMQATTTSLTLCNVNCVDMDGKGTTLEDLLGLTGSHTKTVALHFAVNLQGIVKSTLMAGFTEHRRLFLTRRSCICERPSQWLLQCAQTML